MKKAKPVSNEVGIRNLCEVASRVLTTMPVNAATTFTVRTLMREAVNKSNPNYRGNDNKKNVRYVSRAAAPYLGSKGPAVAEHLIPISVMLNAHLYAAANRVTDTDALVELAKQYASMALISADEDALLRKHKLQSKMPADWDGVDRFARYRAVGIEVIPVEQVQRLDELAAAGQALPKVPALVAAAHAGVEEWRRIDRMTMGTLVTL